MLPAVSGLQPQPRSPTCTTQAAKSGEPYGFAASVRWLPPRCRSPRRADCWLRRAATRSMSDGRAPRSLLPDERRIADEKPRGARPDAVIAPGILEDLAVRVDVHG